MNQVPGTAGTRYRPGRYVFGSFGRHPRIWRAYDLRVKEFVPSDFTVPLGLATSEFVLEPLGPEHNDPDYDAWTSSIEHIKATPGFAGGSWPHEMTRDENRVDLERHADDFHTRKGFTYTVLAPASRDVIGCVYIYPRRDGDEGASVLSWVRTSHAHLDTALWRAVSEWLDADWPFAGVEYAPRQTALLVDEADSARTFDTLTLAFAADPVERWMYPEPRQYLAAFPMFLAAFAGEAFAEKTVWQAGAFSAVALWLPPGTEPDGDAIVSVLTETVAPDRHRDAFAVLEQMDKAHPTFAHWYLPWLGVDPARQGSGIGSKLLADCLDVVDRDQLPAYLETPNPRTIPFYERHGFVATGEARSGECPPITTMLRPARRHVS